MNKKDYKDLKIGDIGIIWYQKAQFLDMIIVILSSAQTYGINKTDGHWKTNKVATQDRLINLVEYFVI